MNSNPFEDAPQSVEKETTPVATGDAWTLENAQREPPKNAEGKEDWSVPNGDYELTLMDLTKGLSKKGKPQAKLTWGYVGEEPFFTENKKYKKFKIFEYQSLDPAELGYFILRERLKALGSMPAEDGRLVIRPAEVIGKKALATLAAEEDFRGVIGSRIQKLSPL